MIEKASRQNRASGFVIPSTFGIRTSSSGAEGAFSILELLVVITIIIVLAGLILATVGYVQKKGARSRAEAEIAAISAALESYKADNGVYPTNPDTNNLDAVTDGKVASSYQKAALYLYGQLSGDYDNNNPTASTNYNNRIDAAETTNKTYFVFRPQMLSGARDPNGNLISVDYIRDPFGNSYGYSTAKASAPSGTIGYNPSFDLWSSGGVISASNPPDQTQWIKNW